MRVYIGVDICTDKQRHKIYGHKHEIMCGGSSGVCDGLLLAMMGGYMWRICYVYRDTSL